MFQSNFKILVNTTNCVGIMGKGIAYEIKKRYPEIMPSYVKACKNKELRPGGILVFNTGNQYIVNLATKDDWKNPSKYEWIKIGVKNLRDWLDKIPTVETVAVPSLGCGLGGLDFSKVKKIIEKELKNSKHNITVFEPTNA